MTTATAARGEMPVVGHVREARRRAARAAVALTIGVVAGFVLAEPILDVLREPVERLASSRTASLNYDTVTGAFDLRLRIAFAAGIVMSSPIWLYELFAFIVPGLTRRERRYALGFSAIAVPLFAAGCAFGFLLFPRMVEVLTGFSSNDDSTILAASHYVDFVLKIVLAIGLAFVLPVLLVMLNAVGVLPAATIRRSWRLTVVGITLFSALVTPAADVLSMFLVAVPMSVLFLGAMLVTHLRDARAVRRGATTKDIAP